MHLQTSIKNIILSKDDKNLSALRSILISVSRIYSQIVALRNLIFQKRLVLARRLPCSVISVGNITVGGTGKTPMTMYIAQLLHEHGYKVVILSRGYKGLSEKTGAIVSDGKNILINSQEAGDEPYMMASCLKHIPIIVGKDRFKSGMKAIQRFSPDVILLDDGFQHQQLARDLDIVLLDATCPFGNGRLIPAGPLREPITALKRANAIILTRCDHTAETQSTELLLNRIVPLIPIFKSYHIPRIRYIKKGDNSKIFERFYKKSKEIFWGQQERVFAFSGLADNFRFHQTISALGFNLCGFIEFPDHHWYCSKDLNTIVQSAQTLNADAIMTTEKDYARIDSNQTFPLDICIWGIDIKFGNDTERFHRFILNQLI